MDVSATAISEFVQRVALPDIEPAYEAVPPPPPEFSADSQALSIGSQLAEFSGKVPAELRAPISNSLLLAQLAADKAASQTQDVVGWYEAYRKVLAQLGWQIHDFEMQAQDVTDQNMSVNKAIIPVITALLGPQVAAASIVLSVLKGLNDMDSSSPWITLFNQSSQHSSGAKFQLSYVDADANGQPQITLVCLAINATRTITQVLFFKFSSASAQLKRGKTTMSTASGLLEAGKAAIQQRVSDYIAANIANIAI
jgi:hypothetical protein